MRARQVKQRLVRKLPWKYRLRSGKSHYDRWHYQVMQEINSSPELKADYDAYCAELEMELAEQPILYVAGAGSFTIKGSDLHLW